MADEQAERTEPATPKRREDARKKGQVAQSKEIQSVVILGVAVISASSALGGRVVMELARVAQSAWRLVEHPPETLADYNAMLSIHTTPAAMALVPLMAVLALGGTLSQIAQTGPLFSLEAMAFKFDRMDPIKGFKRFFSPDRIFELGKSILKVGVVLALGTWVVRDDIALILGTLEMQIVDALVASASVSRDLAIAILFALAVLAVADLFWQRWRHEVRLRMSKQDVKDELKQREGNPQVRSRARQAMRELSRARMIASVAEADVVVTNPTHYAVALRYDRLSMQAPEVLAKGRGHVAARIREVAREHRVPVVENPPLARLLHSTVEVGQAIPENLFQAVAEVLAYVVRLDPRRASAFGGAPA